MIGIALAERGWLPDPAIRVGIRRMLRRRLRELYRTDAVEAVERPFEPELRQGPIALVPDRPNRQHYELPPEFFEAILGPWMKYSCGYWSEPGTDLGDSEEAMLRITCERAELRDGMQILDLGCGWGSLACWVATHHPAAHVLAVSNSKLQQEFILRRKRELGLRNLEARAADVNDFEPEARFDRILSVEMFEHTRNWGRLLQRVASWLAPGGRVFVHHFCHREKVYPYEDRDASDWMARHFFTGGLMPSADLLRAFPEHLEVERSWRVAGEQYQRTCEAWLARLDAARDRLMPVLAQAYGAESATRAFQRWRLFFLACAELFGYRAGQEWWVVHTLLRAAESREPRPHQAGRLAPRSRRGRAATL